MNKYTFQKINDARRNLFSRLWYKAHHSWNISNAVRKVLSRKIITRNLQGQNEWASLMKHFVLHCFSFLENFLNFIALLKTIIKYLSQNNLVFIFVFFFLFYKSLLEFGKSLFKMNLFIYLFFLLLSPQS